MRGLVVDLVWIWCGFGVDLVWIWYGFGVDLVWIWCGFGVDYAWIGCGRVKNLNMITQILIVMFKLTTLLHNLHKMVHFL